MKCGTEDIYITILNFIPTSELIFARPLPILEAPIMDTLTYYGHPTPIRISLKCRSPPPPGGKLCWNSPYLFLSFALYHLKCFRMVHTDTSNLFESTSTCLSAHRRNKVCNQHLNRIWSFCSSSEQSYCHFCHMNLRILFYGL